MTLTGYWREANQRSNLKRRSVLNQQFQIAIQESAIALLGRFLRRRRIRMIRQRLKYQYSFTVRQRVSQLYRH